jgi:acyl carrier protein
MNIRKEIITLIAEKLGIEADKITEKMTLESLHADSLDKIYILNGMEERFDIIIPDKDITKIKTVRGLINFVRQKVNEKPIIKEEPKPKLFGPIDE